MLEGWFPFQGLQGTAVQLRITLTESPALQYAEPHHGPTPTLQPLAPSDDTLATIELKEGHFIAPIEALCQFSVGGNTVSSAMSPLSYNPPWNESIKIICQGGDALCVEVLDMSGSMLGKLVLPLAGIGYGEKPSELQSYPITAPSGQCIGRIDLCISLSKPKPSQEQLSLPPQIMSGAVPAGAPSLFHPFFIPTSPRKRVFTMPAVPPHMRGPSGRNTPGEDMLDPSGFRVGSPLTMDKDGTRERGTAQDDGVV
mmetsp:Transcript_41662/g.67573  ORF Transcript_41662/g.67573 Transcript_41662/m.67573 type:complete len:255 (+) Transcript_41662:360-1124(+)